MPTGALRILVEGLERAEMADYHHGSEYVTVDINFIAKPEYEKIEIEALVRSVSAYFEEYIKLNKKITGDNLLKCLGY